MSSRLALPCEALRDGGKLASLGTCLFLSTVPIPYPCTYSCAILAQTGAAQRLENSILPSVSVGTPLQVAGRYLQKRTVRKTLRSPVGPALSSMSGLCTRPSIPMMKLTFTFVPSLAAGRRGLGVARASGGCVSSHRERASACCTSLNCELRPGGVPIFFSFSA